MISQLEAWSGGTIMACVSSLFCSRKCWLAFDTNISVYSYAKSNVNSSLYLPVHQEPFNCFTNVLSLTMLLFCGIASL